MILFITNSMSQQRPLSVKAAKHVAYAFCFVALFIIIYYFHPQANRVHHLSVLFVCPINIGLTDCTL